MSACAYIFKDSKDTNSTNTGIILYRYRQHTDAVFTCKYQYLPGTEVFAVFAVNFTVEAA